MKKKAQKPQFSAKLKDGDVVSFRNGMYIRKGKFTGRIAGIYQTAKAQTVIDENGAIQKISIPRGIAISGNAVARVA